MREKLVTAGLALVALAAFALPEVTSASPQITHPTGTRLTPRFSGATSLNCAEGGTCLTLTSIGNTLLATDPLEGAPTVLTECTKVVMTGSLTKNDGTTIEGDITTATFSGAGEERFGMPLCKGLGGFGDLTPTTNGKHAVKTGGETFKTDGEEIANGTPWCFKSGASDKFTVRGGTCGEAPRPIVFIMNTVLGGECKMEKSTAIEGTFQTGTEAGKDAVFTLTGGAGTTFKKASGGVLCSSTGTLAMSFTMETDAVATEPVYLS